LVRAPPAITACPTPAPDGAVNKYEKIKPGIYSQKTTIIYQAKDGASKGAGKVKAVRLNGTGDLLFVWAKDGKDPTTKPDPATSGLTAVRDPDNTVIITGNASSSVIDKVETLGAFGENGHKEIKVEAEVVVKNDQGGAGAKAGPSSAKTEGAVVTIEIISIEGEDSIVAPDRAYREKAGQPRAFAPNRMYVQTRDVLNNGKATTDVIRANVVVTAKVTPKDGAKKVYWSWSDPDEPEGAVPNDKDDDGGDNRGGNGIFLKFKTSDFDRPDAASSPDADGLVKVRFAGTDFGGDNFIVGAGSGPGANNSERFAGSCARSKTLTVWKWHILEESSKLAGLPIPIDIKAELEQVYVEIEYVSKTGTDINPVEHRTVLLTVGGYTYGPVLQAEHEALADSPLLAQKPEFSQVVITRAMRPENDLIDANSLAKIPFRVGVNYVYKGALDRTDDIDLGEVGVFGSVLATFFERGGVPRRRSFQLWHDTINVLLAAMKSHDATLTFEDVWKDFYWHESTHLLGLKHEDAENRDRDIAAAGNILGRGNDPDAGIKDMARRAKNHRWFDKGALKVRKDYIPLAIPK